MTTQPKRIAINIGGGYVPGLNAVIAGTVLAASELGWEVVGIRDGFEGLLFPERYPDGGLVKLTRETVGHLSSAAGASWVRQLAAIRSTCALSMPSIKSKR